ncbi:MAG: signal peptidase II [wastewater metagenome]|nr:signal peptidase II [Candidatus Loosdrechtia aerotolerans]
MHKLSEGRGGWIIHKRMTWKDAFTFVAVISGGVIADLLSKWIVFAHLEKFERVTLIPGFFNILRSENEGVVFGIFPGRTTAFIIFSIIAIIIIVCVYIWSDKTLLISNVALGLILAGAIGNLWDRVWYGHVRDFIDLHIGEKYHWPTFNVADSLICIGISIMVFGSFPSKKTQ